jgi:hypothetical protein
VDNQTEGSSFSPVIRIALRYLAGYLLFKALIPPEIAAMLSDDPLLVGLIGSAITATVEGFYIMARKFGWAK